MKTQALICAVSLWLVSLTAAQAQIESKGKMIEQQPTKGINMRKTSPPCAENPDGDGDGVNRIGCGGTDCDDADPSRFPGAAEVCDAAEKDEDCDPSTFGHQDRDHDGFVSVTCVNADRSGRRTSGLDCDDNNEAIAPGEQVCASNAKVRICRAGGLVEQPCPPRTTCVAQPNGTGLCVPGGA